MEKSELENLSWYPLITFFIEKGHLAVPFFWILSGFVIASSYTTNMWRGPRVFFLFRFARLYPLHLVTLILVTALQLTSLRLNGESMIYDNHSISNFFLHLFFLSGFSEAFDGKSFSFNAPVWSVSLELMCYALFALLMMLKKLNSKSVFFLLFFIVLLDIFSTLPDQLIRVNLFFFSGVAIYFLKVKKHLIIHFFILCIGGIVTSVGNILIFFSDNLPTLQFFQYRYNFYFALIILTLLWLEPRVPLSMSNRFIELGNLSYAMYLLHIPIQIVLLLSLPFLVTSPEDIKGKFLFLLAFLFIVLIISKLTFKNFEQPCREKIRQAVQKRP